jgi:hypothetical protein
MEAMTIGLAGSELAAQWNQTLRDLESKLAQPMLPAGVSVSDYVSNPAAIRVPEPDPTKYPTYSAYMDMAAAVIAMISLNNKRIAQQLRAAGVNLV